MELQGFKRSEVFLHTKMGMICTYFSTALLFICLYIYIFDTTLIPLFLFFFCFKAIQSTFRLEEMSNSLSQQLDEERKRRATAVQTLAIVENSNTDLKKKLIVEEQARKSVDAALKGAAR